MSEKWPMEPAGSRAFMGMFEGVPQDEFEAEVAQHMAERFAGAEWTSVQERARRRAQSNARGGEQMSEPDLTVRINRDSTCADCGWMATVYGVDEAQVTEAFEKVEREHQAGSHPRPSTTYPFQRPSRSYIRPPLRGQPAYVEIVERKPQYDSDSENGAEHLIRPNEVRINGTPLLIPSGETVKVHDLSLSESGCVQVTLTLWARRVVVESEQAGVES